MLSDHKSFIFSEDNLNELCVYLLDISAHNPHVFFLLNGDLGSGKTTLVKEFVKFFLKTDGVTSPTFSISQDYEDKVFHYDLYQREFGHLLELGFLELFERKGIHFIEWAEDHLRDMLKRWDFFTVTITITPLQDNQRKYEITQ